MDMWLQVVLIASVAVALGMGIRVLMLLGSIRRQSRKGFETAMRLQEDWDAYAARQEDERRRLVERIDQFEGDMRDRVEGYEKLARGTRERLIKLEQYLKEFFEVELKAVFDSFDKTVASILDEMKAELLRGVERIEDIQAVVDSKSLAKDRILDGEGSVYRLIADKPEEEAQEGLPEEQDVGVASGADEDEATELRPESPRRLQADEAES